MNTSKLIVVVALTGACLAQGPKTVSAARRATHRPVANAPSGMLPNVLYDRATAASDLWAMGHTWKARIDPAGMTFVPFFGSHAPSNYPVRVEVLSATVAGQSLELVSTLPEHRGDTVRTQRGGLVEVLDLEVAQIEQSFVFESLPVRGELIVRVGLTSDLAVRRTNGGLLLGNEHGSMTYRKAVAVDAAGRREPLDILWHNGVASIAIPASFVEHAKLPLVLDPILQSSLSLVNGTTMLLTRPDVATLQQPDRTCRIWRRRWSATDEDCLALLTDATHATIGSSVGIDITTENWSNPRVAANANSRRFLITSRVGSGAASTISSRLLNDTGFLHPKVTLLGPGPTLVGQVDVGGDPYPSTSAYFCVVWHQEIWTGTLPQLFVDNSIQVLAVDQNGQPLAPGARRLNPLNDPASVKRPSISKSNDTGDWMVAYEAGTQAGMWNSNGIAARRVTWQGVPTGSFSQASPLNPFLNHYWRPVASSPAAIAGQYYWMVAWESADGIEMRVVDAQGGLHSQQNLGELETGAINSGQIKPHVDSDGARFAICYQEPYQGSQDAETKVTTVAYLPATDTYRGDDVRQGLGLSTSDEVDPRICAMHSGGRQASSKYQIVDTKVGSNDIQMWSYGGYSPGMFWSYFPTQCGLAWITPSGTPAVGDTVSFSVTGGALSGTVFGYPGYIPLTSLGCNCVLGVTGGYLTGNQVTWTVPSNPNVVGMTLSIQGWTALGSNCLGTVDVSDTVDFTIR